MKAKIVEGKFDVGKKIRWEDAKGEQRLGTILEVSRKAQTPMRAVVRGPRNRGIFILEIE